MENILFLNIMKALLVLIMCIPPIVTLIGLMMFFSYILLYVLKKEQ